GSIQYGICDLGSRVQIIRVYDFFRTTRTVAKHLGHALGALNDGSEALGYCLPEASYIISAFRPRFEDPRKKHTLNPWTFSACSEVSFKMALVN
ncbi:hypothetical protein ACJMK2_001339, partial [Sinanodonta woodiana]